MGSVKYHYWTIEVGSHFHCHQLSPPLITVQPPWETLAAYSGGGEYSLHTRRTVKGVVEGRVLVYIQLIIRS